MVSAFAIGLTVLLYHNELSHSADEVNQSGLKDVSGASIGRFSHIVRSVSSACRRLQGGGGAYPSSRRTGSQSAAENH